MDDTKENRFSRLMEENRMNEIAYKLSQECGSLCMDNAADRLVMAKWIATHFDSK